MLRKLSVLSALLAMGLAHGQVARTFLSKAEVDQEFSGKTQTFKHLASGNLIKWDMRSGGRMYWNNMRNANIGANGAAKWSVRDDGALCVVFPDDSGCNFYFRDGTTLMRVNAQNPDGQPNAEVLKIE